MKEIALKGTVRTKTGKKASKDLRKQNLIPCNLYGEAKDENGTPTAEAFAIPFTEIRKAVYTPDVLICNINIDGKEHKAIIKELQFHPVSDALLHADFLEVNETKPITIGIPVSLEGHAQGVRDGGRMSQSIRKIAVKAPYKNIPEKLIVDVTNLKIGKSIKVGNLHYEGLELVTRKEVIVCSVKMTREVASAATAEEPEEQEEKAEE
jgi:large subunit ribosomal protein L25